MGYNAAFVPGVYLVPVSGKRGVLPSGARGMFPALFPGAGDRS